MTSPAIADIGVLGGSGFYEFLADATEVAVETPHGPPAAHPVIATVDGRRVAFLPRHGRQHEFAPHTIPYRANLWALQVLGVRAIFGPCASGSVRPDIAPGDFVVCDQLVDRTWGRPDTYYDGGGDPRHVSLADPYDDRLRRVAIEAGRAEGVTVHERGTVVVIPGPRFATRAESRWYRMMGGDVINMTQYPEVALAAELDIPYAAIALITDYDTGIEHEPGIEPVTQEQVFAFMAQNVDRVRALLLRAVAAVPSELLESGR